MYDLANKHKMTYSQKFLNDQRYKMPDAYSGSSDSDNENNVSTLIFDLKLFE